MTKFVTHVIRLPDDTASCTAIGSGLAALITRYGGKITASSMDDEITINEYLAERLGLDESEEVRAEAIAFSQSVTRDLSLKNAPL